MFDHIQAYHQARSVKEAVRLLQDPKTKTWVVAGGTDVALRADRSVRVLVDISRAGLTYINKKDRALHIGATTTMATIEGSSLTQRFAHGILAKAAAACGSPQTRNVATIGGNLANASPAADTATPLLALDAKVVLQGARSRRTLPVEAFFTGPHVTAAARELLIEVVLPATESHTAWSFQRLGRTEMDIALVNAAVAIQLDSKHRCTYARVALGAVARCPMRAVQAEAVLVGQILNAGVIEQAAEAAQREIEPISDVRASAEYRREIAGVLVRRTIEECAQHLELNRLSAQEPRGGAR